MKKDQYTIMANLENTYWWYVILHKLVEFYVKKECKKTKSDLHILDAGCGTGRVIELMSQYGQVEGIDYSEEAIKFCRSRQLKNINQEDLNLWQPKENMYDIIISLDVLYHKAIKDDQAIIKKFHLGLKKNGLLILNLPAFDCLKRKHDEAVSGQRRYQKNKIEQMLKENGFKIEKISYRLPILFLVLIIKKYFKLDKASGDLKDIPTWLNHILIGIHYLENIAIKKNINMPFGSSLFVVARKK